MRTIRRITIGIILVLIFFPHVRATIGTAIGVVLAAILGVILTVLFLAGPRTRPR